MDYAMLQIFLTAREQIALFPMASQTRRQYLEAVFMETRVDFVHRGNPYTYLYVSEASGIIAGAIGRQLQEEVNAGPEERFQIRERTDWYTANVFINPASGDGGQLVAFQIKQRLGAPIAIFGSLVQHINDSHTSAWRMEVNPIVDTRDFWAVVREYQNRLTAIEFQFLTPNLWGSESETEKALSKFQRENGAQGVDVELVNKDGNLNPDSPQVRESIDYIGRGGGSVRAKTGPRVIYNSSEERAQSQTIEDSEDAPVQAATIDTLMVMIRRLFGL